jgi:ribosomal protein S18 acetylase RimI-like enzyme
MPQSAPGAIEPATGLSTAQLAAVAELERRVLAHDGGRLKLEWGALRSRPGDRVNDFLWWAPDGEPLLGFCGIYRFGNSTPEVTGMVDPAVRRRGIGAALLDASRGVCAERSWPKPLLVVPRASVGGRALAERCGGKLEHSEHALVLHGDPTDGPTDPRVTLRVATSADVEAVGRILRAGFDWVPDDLAAVLDDNTARERTVVIDRDGSPVGTLRLTLDSDRAGIYGFAVDPAEQGKGIGRDALRRCCRMLREEGARSVGLEVLVDNERALGLYTSVGFTPVTTEDYYALG